MAWRLALAVLATLIAGEAGFARSAELSGKYVVSRSASDRQGWLELRTFPLASARALTPRPAPGERRTDCCARFSPDGTKLVFRRRTQLRSKLLLLDLVTGALRTVVQRPGARDWQYVWARDSRSLLHSTYDLSDGKVHRVPTAGPSVTLSQHRSYGGTWPEDTSPDGTVALVVESAGEPLYNHYEGPDVLYALGGGKKVKLATTDSVGGASWSPDGTLVAYTANCFSLCNIEVVRPDGRGRRALTRFRTRTSHYYGFDEISFEWAGRPGEIVYGRGRTLYGIDSGLGGRRRIATLPCPRLRCTGSRTIIDSLSRERDVAFVSVIDTEFDEANVPEASRLYEVSLLSGSFVAADRLATADDIWSGHSP